jgi:hypothetical protein
MNSEQEETKDEVQDPAVADALAHGRNANDNFNEDEADDYGDEGDVEEQRKRDRIKGGSGQHGVIRNRNDDFEKEPKS